MTSAIGGPYLDAHRIGAGGPRRVLVVGDHLGYPGGVSHGVTSYYLQVLPALRESGVSVSACFLREPHPAAVELRDLGIAVRFLSIPRWDPGAALRVASIARHEQATILHAAGIKGTLMARLAARFVPAGTLLHLHDLIRPGALVGTLHGLCARPSDLAVCVSSAAIPVAVEGYHVARDRVRVIHNGIRLERFRDVPPERRSAVRESFGLDQVARILLVVGRMYPIKGHRVLLRMMPDIVRQHPGVMLVLAGDGPEREPCQRLVADLGLQDRVRFLGQRNDIPELLAASDVVALPSESEGFPISAIEALANGKPVVAFRVGGIPEVITDGVTGRLVEPGDAEGFVNAVVSICGDDALRAQLGAQATVAAGSFTVEAHVGQLLRAYDELAGAPARDGH